MMSENPGYQTDNLLASTVAHFPSGTLFHAFSTPIYATRVKENLNEIQAELGRSYRKNTFTYKEEFGMTHQLSDTSFGGNVIVEDNLKLFEDVIHFHLCNYMTGIKFPQDVGRSSKTKIEDVNYTIAQSWWSKFGYRDYAHLHNHGNSDVSGVYYFQAPSSEEISTYNTPWGTQPEGNIYFSSPAPSSVTSFVYAHYAFKQSMLAEVGKMVLFPAYLDHGVTTNETKEDRVSLAFNINFEKS